MGFPYEENSYEDVKHDVTKIMDEYVDGLICVVTMITLENCTYIDNELVDINKGLNDFFGFLFVCLSIVGFIIRSCFLLKEIQDRLSFIFNALNLKKLDFLPLEKFMDISQY